MAVGGPCGTLWLLGPGRGSAEVYFHSVGAFLDGSTGREEGGLGLVALRGNYGDDFVAFVETMVAIL